MGFVAFAWQLQFILVKEQWLDHHYLSFYFETLDKTKK
jgi:hypothetical protein